MKRTNTLIAGVLALALVAASCGAASDKISEKIAEKAIEAAGGGELDVDISGDGDDFTVSIESEDGSFSSESNVDLPDELAMPFPDDGNVQMSGVQNDDAFASIIYPGGRYDEIIGFYEDWTAGTGDEWDLTTSSIDMGDDGTLRSSIWGMDGGSTHVMVSNCHDAGLDDSGSLNAVCVTLGQSG